MQRRIACRIFLNLVLLSAVLISEPLLTGGLTEAAPKRLAQLVGVDFGPTDSGQVIISLKGSPKYRISKEGKKAIVIIQDCVAKINPGEKKPKSKSPLRLIRWSQHKKNRVWVVLEFHGEPQYKEKRSSGKIIVDTSPAPSKLPSPKTPAPVRQKRPQPQMKQESGTTFSGQFGPLPPEVKKKVETYSWRKGCPVKADELAYLRMSHWGYDGRVHQGEMIVHKSVAGEVLSIFVELYENRFPIEKMRLIDDYKGADSRSMADNNTSAFNCRLMTGSKHSFSKHSWGIAIDINPMVNPYVKGDTVLPPQGKKFLDRTKPVKGLIRKGEVCHSAFAKRGWTWGGSWKHRKDYQHFEKNTQTGQ